MNVTEKPAHKSDSCRAHMLAISETLRLLNGKWKITILGSLSFGRKRFTGLQRDVEGIGPKMLSKTLQDLEQNGLVARMVNGTKPVTVEYEMTDYGKTLQDIIREITLWGALHKKQLQKKQVK